MGKSLKLLFYKLLAATICSGMLIDHTQAAMTNVCGEWDSTLGTITFKQFGSSSSVTGSYTNSNGLVKGTVSNTTLNGYWTQTSALYNCSTKRNGRYYWGKFSFVSTADSFTGNYGYCNDSPGYPWNGSRLKPAPRLSQGVYWTARDDDKYTDNVHHYILLVTPRYYPVNGTKALTENGCCAVNYFHTMGVFKENDNMVNKVNKWGDVTSVRKFLNPKQYQWSTLNLQTHGVSHPSLPTGNFTNAVVELNTKFRSRIDVPWEVDDDNGAAWVNTLLKIAGINDATRFAAGDFDGVNYYEDFIDEAYFQ